MTASCILVIKMLPHVFSKKKPAAVDKVGKKYRLFLNQKCHIPRIPVANYTFV